MQQTLSLNILGFKLYKLMMAVTYGCPPKLLKGYGNCSIKTLTALDHHACHFDITCAIGSSYSLLSSASLCMVMQVAGGLHITLIKEATDETGLGAALNCSTFERVSFMVVSVFNCGERLEENINWCVPVLLQSY
jgi:hypothetical protein